MKYMTRSRLCRKLAATTQDNLPDPAGIKRNYRGRCTVEAFLLRNRSPTAYREDPVPGSRDSGAGNSHGGESLGEIIVVKPWRDVLPMYSPWRASVTSAPIILVRYLNDFIQVDSHLLYDEQNQLNVHDSDRHIRKQRLKLHILEIMGQTVLVSVVTAGNNHPLCFVAETARLMSVDSRNPHRD